MSYYANPIGKTKEEFLEEKGTAVKPDFKWEDTPKGSLPVVLIKNAPFTGAVIVLSKEELDYFSRPDDYRPRKIYVVSIVDLVAHANDSDFNRLVKNGGVPV